MVGEKQWFYGYCVGAAVMWVSCIIIAPFIVDYLESKTMNENIESNVVEQNETGVEAVDDIGKVVFGDGLHSSPFLGGPRVALDSSAPADAVDISTDMGQQLMAAMREAIRDINAGLLKVLIVLPYQCSECGHRGVICQGECDD